MDDLREKPDAAMIDRNRAQLHEIWSPARRQWEDYDAYYYRTYPVWEGMQQHTRPSWLKPAKPTDLVDHAVDALLSSEPQVHRNPVRGTQKAKDQADTVEPGLQAILQDAALEEPVATWKALGKNLIHLGYGIAELTLDGDVLARRAEFPEQTSDMDDAEFKSLERLHQHYRRTAQPFRIRVPHPSTVLLDPWQKRPKFAIRHDRRTAIDLHNLTRMWKEQGKSVDVFDMGKHQPYDLMVVDEYWSEYWHSMVVSGFVNGKGSSGIYTYNNNQRKMIFNLPNSWGFVPYAHAYAGFGQEPTNASKRDPSYLARGLLDALRADIKAQAQAINGRHRALMNATFTKVGTTMGAEELRDMLEDGGDILGEIQKGDVWEIETNQLQRWMFQTVETYERDIEEGSFSSALAGHRQAGVNTVGQQSILSTAASKKLVGVRQQEEHIASVIGSQVLQLIDLLDLDLTVKGQHIRASDLDKDYSVQVSFDVVDPVIQMQQRQQDKEDVMSGHMSTPTYWERGSRIENQVQERDRLVDDQLYRNPLLIQELAIEAAKRLGVEELIRRAMERMQAQEAEAKEAAGDGGLVGLDGQPLNLTQGQDGGPARAVEELRQGLTPEVLSPARNGQNRAGQP